MHTLAQLRSGELAGITRLDLSCGLSEFPPEIFALADSLEILNLSGNALSSLPGDLHRLRRLKVLFCSENRFTELPEAVGQCAALEVVGFKANRIRHVPGTALPSQLRWLILTDNEVAELPAELGRRPRLQKLMLAGNRLQHLPEQMATCQQLELLRIAANHFVALPPWLLALPRLTWLAYAGNPLGVRAQAQQQMRQATAHGTGSRTGTGSESIDWHSLTLQAPPLGEGASGVIHPALWQQPPEASRPVALKLFKGAVTSDGSPASEMAACVAAGSHAHLVGSLGALSGHPAGMQGMVMDRLPPTFRNVAGPPSLTSCTRDVYAPGASFSVAVVRRLACGIASAVAHLHGRGILHGDLYAHNILWDGRGHALLGDFGAASFLPADDETASIALQRMEVRAFGCLLEEWLAHCQDADEVLSEWQARCLHEPAAARPLFSEIHQALAAM